MDTQYLTQEKLDEIKQERKTLKDVTIPDLAKRIDDARQMGDLSENAEYHAAREEMAWAQSRVKEIDGILQNAEIISSAGNSDTVSIGHTVTVLMNGNTKEYTIVGAQEADPLSGKISNESPLGEAFLGKSVGDQVTVEIPAGTQEYKITAIR